MTLLSKPAPPEWSDETWNLHLRGLPPCEGAGGANEVALAMCSESRR
jgi:hypothetical protein